MPNVHLIVGDDDLLLHRATERLLDQVKAAHPDVEVDLYEAAELDHLPEMRTASLFGGSHCLVLRGVQDARGDLKAEIEDYLERPDPDALLILVGRGLARNTVVHRRASDVGEVITVAAPPDWKDDEWAQLVKSEFARLDRKVHAHAIQAILEHAGRVPAVIATKVAQVAASTSAGRTVSTEDVEAVVEGHGQQSGFALADAVTDRDAARALVVLRGALESGTEPIALLGALVYRFRQLLQARGGADAATVGTSPNNHRRLVGIARRFGPGELAWCHDRLAQLDIDLKGNSELPAELLIELAVIDLATPREVGAPFNPLATTAP